MGRHGTIAGRKAAQDSKRAAMFTKYARAITVAAKDAVSYTHLDVYKRQSQYHSHRIRRGTDKGRFQRRLRHNRDHGPL